MIEVPRLRTEGICKAYPGVQANVDVDLEIMPGEIHALLGENGAGKSTLVKIIYGVQRADAGRLFWEGTEVRLSNPNGARALGIGMVFQHFSLFDALTVEENISLGISPELARGNLSNRIQEVSAQYGLPLDPERYVDSLSVGERQRIEVVRCLLQNPRLLIMDEPTSVLTPQETEALFETLRQLADDGVSILYISHKLEEIRVLCHGVTIMRAGRVVARCDPARETARSLAEIMMGENFASPHRDEGPSVGDVALELKGVSTTPRLGTSLKSIDLSVRTGEIVGIAGVAGNGQNELMEVLAGEVQTSPPDSVLVRDQPVGHLGTVERRARAMAFVPEERIGHGAVSELSLWENVLLSALQSQEIVRNGFISVNRASTFANQIVERFRVRTPSVSNIASSLSGGNLQKFIVGREILQNPGVIIAVQPTWGVDAGSASAIRQALLDLANTGAAVLVVSQDLEELFEISDRIAVICEGRLSETCPVDEVTVEEIGLMMAGLPVSEAVGKHDQT